MKYGTSVSEQEWADLMRSAREQATLLGTRTKVVASIHDARGQRYTGRKYTWHTLVPVFVGTTRCGATDADHKPCIRYYNTCYGFHISRDAKPTERVGWGKNEPGVIDSELSGFIWTGELA